VSTCHIFGKCVALGASGYAVVYNVRKFDFYCFLVFRQVSGDLRASERALKASCLTFRGVGSALTSATLRFQHLQVI